MLKQVALILSVVIVALLAIVAAMTIVNREPGNDVGDDADGTPPVTNESRTTVVATLGASQGQVEVGCTLPVENQSPLLVAFENRTELTADYQAQVSVRHADGSITTVVAEADDLRPGERRSVQPEPWLEPGGISGCDVVAIQTDDHVILVESD